MEDGVKQLVVLWLIWYTVFLYSNRNNTKCKNQPLLISAILSIKKWWKILQENVMLLVYSFTGLHLLAYQTETPETGRPKSWSSTFTNPQRSQTSSAMSGNHFSSFPLKTTFDTLNNLMMSSDASVYVNKVVVWWPLE